MSEQFMTSIDPSKVESISAEQLLACVSLIKPYKRPEFPKKTVKWFEKLMNHFGWFRQTTVYVLNPDSFKPNLNFMSGVES